MKRCLPILFLLLPISAGANTWSHQAYDNGDRTSDSKGFITKWIGDGEPVRYCVFVEDEAPISQESADLQVRVAVRTWLKSLGFYDPNNRMFDTRGNGIDPNGVFLKKLTCDFQSDQDYHGIPRGRDETGQEIPRLSFLSVFFTSRPLKAGSPAFYSQVIGGGSLFFPPRPAPHVDLVFEDHPFISIPLDQDPDIEPLTAN
jgi:hypothetical protein